MWKSSKSCILFSLLDAPHVLIHIEQPFHYYTMHISKCLEYCKFFIVLLYIAVQCFLHLHVRFINYACSNSIVNNEMVNNTDSLWKVIDFILLYIWTFLTDYGLCNKHQCIYKHFKYL